MFLKYIIGRNQARKVKGPKSIQTTVTYRPIAINVLSPALRKA